MTVSEQGLRWRRSSYSLANGDCVEVALTPAAVAVRDSKNTAGPNLTFTTAGWRAFLRTR